MKLVKEHIEFKRGKEPKDAMSTGVNKEQEISNFFKFLQKTYSCDVREFPWNCFFIPDGVAYMFGENKWYVKNFTDTTFDIFPYTPDGDIKRFPIEYCKFLRDNGYFNFDDNALINQAHQWDAKIKGT